MKYLKCAKSWRIVGVIYHIEPETKISCYSNGSDKRQGGCTAAAAQIDPFDRIR